VYEIKERAKEALCEIKDHLENGIIAFWSKNAIDGKYGGYLTCFDEFGNATGDMDKYIVTQTRMIWGMSALYGEYPQRRELLEYARQGVKFFIRYFWDREYGGWFWKVKRNGECPDTGKVVYGQSFAIYALTEYARNANDPEAMEYAEKTFDILQKFCADTCRGGYFENLEADWILSEPGYAGGDKKSLDVHMHLMEAFTILAEYSGKEIHFRKLEEITKLIVDKMISRTSGCGYNQFDVDFNPVPAINIKRTWNAEREAGEIVKELTDTTSYGHNVELAWLLNRAADVMRKPFDYYNDITKRLIDHSITYGLDHELGGVFRDGPHNGDALIKDKEWWQNSEVLVGYLDAFERLKDTRYFNAFYKTWCFDREYFINHDIGEWRQLLSRNGSVISGTIGNSWKAIYHTGRAMLECKRRLERIIDMV